MTALNKLFTSLISAFDDNGVDYCVIGNYENLPDSTDNDVDFWVDNILDAEALLLDIALNNGIKLYMQNKTAIGSNNYFYKVENNKIELIKIDLMTETSYKSCFEIVSSNTIKNNRSRYNGFYIANSQVECVMHILYPLISLGVVKDKYKTKLKEMVSDYHFIEILTECVGLENKDIICSSVSSEDWGLIIDHRRKITSFVILKTIKNLGRNRAYIFFRFFYSIFYRVIKKNGLFIVISGVDGAGKSTLKERLMVLSDSYFTKSRSRDFYWRPFLIPRISSLLKVEGGAEVVMNTGVRKLPMGFFHLAKYYIKYLYYVVDFFFGKIKYYSSLHRGGLVLFDRYHFDNIVYPERFGFSVNKIIMRFIDKLIIPQPDILFYFTGNPETLYQRKKEISINDIVVQDKKYRSELRHKKNSKIIYTDKTIQETEFDVLMICLKHLSERYV